MSNFTTEQLAEMDQVCREIIAEMNKSTEAMFIVSNVDEFQKYFEFEICVAFRKYYSGEFSREELLYDLNETFCSAIDFQQSELRSNLAPNPHFQA